MKIVINNCYGGFSLSETAVKYIINKGGGSLKKYKPEDYFRENWKEQLELNKQQGWVIYIDGYIWSEREIDRTDPLLIEAVKKLKHGADGRCAELKIVTIPDGIDWEIDDYDGLETIDEVHSSWR